MESIYKVYVLSLLEENMSYLLIEGFIEPKLADAIVNYSQVMVSVVAPNALEIVDGFGIPEAMLIAPIAGDWVHRGI